MKTNIFYFLSWTIWCADPWLISRCVATSFTVTWRFPSRWLQLLQMASGVTTQCAWPGRVESVTRTNALHETSESTRTFAVVTDMHHRTELSFVDEFRWVSPLHYSKNGWQNAVLLWCMLQVGPPTLHHYCAIVLHSCIVLPPVGNSSSHEYHCCQLTRQSSCVSNFYRTFKVFVWLSLLKQKRRQSHSSDSKTVCSWYSIYPSWRLGHLEGWYECNVPPTATRYPEQLWFFWRLPGFTSLFFWYV